MIRIKQKKMEIKLKIKTLKNWGIYAPMVLTMSAMAAIVGGCERVDTEHQDDAPDGYVTMTINVSTVGTRGLEADGASMTDIWVVDMVADTIAAVMHQTSVDEQFGTITRQMEYGEHQLYAVAARGDGGVLDEGALRISWSKLRDSFWASKSITVARGASADVSILLTRAIAKIRLVLQDEVKSNMSAVSMSAELYKTMDITTGLGVEPQQETSETAIPTAYYGTSGKLAITYYTLCPTAEQWQTDIEVSVIDDEGAAIGTAEVPGVGLKRNSVTNISGYILGKSGSSMIDIDPTWGDPIEYIIDE